MKQCRSLSGENRPGSIFGANVHTSLCCKKLLPLRFLWRITCSVFAVFVLALAACDNPSSPKEPDTYGVSVNVTGTHAFDDAYQGYAAIAPLIVTVANTGNQATGALTLGLSGTNAAGFTLSGGSIPSIPAGGTGTFTVGPTTGLTPAGGAAGTYTATVTLSGGNGIDARFPVSFTVKPQSAYDISLSQTGTHAFDDAYQGYAAITPLSVIVANTGTSPTGALTLGLSGTNAASFTLSAGSISSIAAGGIGIFTIGPQTGLTVTGGAAGTYTATVTVAGGNGITASFNLSFTVTSQPAYDIRLSKTGIHAFDDAYQGYAAITPLSVTVANTGTSPTGALTAALSGTNAGSFTLSSGSITSIEAGETGTFTIGPKTGLTTTGGAAGTYTATVTVAGSNGITASFNLSFTVKPRPAYGVSLSKTGTHAFDDANQGYAAITPLRVTVANIGTSRTGALTVALSGTNAVSFTLSAGSISTIAAGGTGTFTIGPKTGLTTTGGAAGTYTATVTVAGGNGITASFNLSFTVNAAQTYSIALDKTGTHAFDGVNVGYTTITPLTVTVTNTGSDATGALTAALSGANAGSFTLSDGSINSIAVSETGTFAIGPKTGLTAAGGAAGTYGATVTVSGDNGITASFDVSFTVKPRPAYGVSLSKTGTHAFDDAYQGYAAIAPLTVTVTNTGNQATGSLTAALSGANAGSFTLSAGSISSLAAGGTGAFAVVPNAGLTTAGGTAGTYRATVTVSGGNGITASFGVSFTVKTQLAYGISLSKTGTHAFDDAYQGYSVIAPLTVTVANTGNQATGSLTVALSGTNAGSFTLSAGSISSLAAGGTGAFAVVPNAGLTTAGGTAGTYTGTVTVSGGNGITASFDVSFTVKTQPAYGISLSKTGTHAFDSAHQGYAAIAPLTVTVTNTGNQATGSLTAAISGTNAGSFTLSDGSINSIAVSGTGIFTIGPKTSLSVGTYTGTVTVSDGNGITASFGVSFTVNAARTYSIALDKTETHAFTDVYVGYAAIAPLTVTVTNTGNQATGALIAALSGGSASSFTLSGGSINSIAVSDTGTFTVVPNTGLGAGTYTATVTVSGGNGIAASFDLSFTVNAAPTYGIALSVNGTHTFPGKDHGYGGLGPLAVTVTNTGNQATGALIAALSGGSASSFTLSNGSINSIAVSGTGTFTVVPNTGLGAGTYTATVTVTGGNGIAASFGLSFTVNAAPTYSIALSVNGTHTFLEDGVEYVAVDPLTVTVTNTGNQATGQLTAALSGTYAGSFVLSAGPIASITTAGGTGTFTIGPKTSLSKGTYTATVTVTGGNGIAASFGLSFTVGDVYTRILSVAAYLDKATGGTTVSDPVPLRVKIGAGNQTALRNAINTAGKYVALDLSPSFPETSSIESYAFQWCTKLASVNFPEATSIGSYAFQGCTGLTSISFPEASSIGGSAFASCTGLTSISFPEASSIGSSAFYNCTGLTSISFPEASSIGRAAFDYCTDLITASFPKAISIDSYAFENCYSLTTATFPEATFIEGQAFLSCDNLASVSLPKAIYIRASAFTSTGGTALTITLGSAPPMVDYSIFTGISVSKTVTVRVPSSAVAAYNTTWQDAFKGIGNNPDGYTGSVNANINLIIQGY